MCIRDRFTIVLQDVKNHKAIEEIAGQLCGAFKKPFVFLRRKIMVTTSIGISVFPEDGREISDLLKHADTAMFKAKKNRDKFYFYKRSSKSATDNSPTEVVIYELLKKIDYKENKNMVL